MKNIILIGDSIRRVYDGYVQNRLRSSANVYYPNDNCRFAHYIWYGESIMGEQAAIPILRKMAMEPDNYVPKSSLKYIYTRGVFAIYLLGKLGDVDSIEMLFDIVERKGLTDIPDFTLGEFYNEATDVYSQYVLFASRALVEIAKKHPDKRKAIAEKLIGFLDNPEYHIMITLRDNSASLHDLKPKMIDYINNMTT